jgi:uncharacterized protein (TIGR03435 family)
MRPLSFAASCLLLHLSVVTVAMLISPGTSRLAAQTVSFETASVKANRSGEDGMSAGRRGNRYTALNAPLKFLIFSSLNISFESSRLIGGPEWIENERFDIVAAVPEGALPADIPRMLRTLLEQRFHLVVHAETREIPIYALRLARTDGKLGPRLTPSKLDCAALLAGRGAVAPLPPQADGRPTCRISTSGRSFRGGGTSIALLAAILPQQVGRSVEDRTGLSGLFDFDLEFSAEGRDVGAATVPGDPPSIFTALQEQLGLRLESTPAPVEVFVIDKVERPTED